MQTNDEPDEWMKMLEADYRAPPLDDLFSSNLLDRLQADVAQSKSTPRIRRSKLAVVCGGVAIAGSVIAAFWVANRPTHDVVKIAGLQSPRDSNTDLLESKDSRVEQQNRGTEPGIPLSQVENFSVIEERQLRADAKLDTFERLSSESKLESVSEASEPIQLMQQRKGLAVVTIQGKSYAIEENGRLVESNHLDNSRRIVGQDNWHDSVAIGVADGSLLIVSDDQIYRVNQESGVRQGLGKPHWDESKTRLTVGEVLFIVHDGRLHRLDAKSKEK